MGPTRAGRGGTSNRALCRALVLASLLAPGALPGSGPEAPAPDRPRPRDLGLAPGSFPPGPLDAITDVPGVKVGHVTLVEGEGVRTGATAVLPHGGNVFRQKVPAAIVVGNGFGKLVGATQVAELGQLETPILLTNTLSVWEAAAALVDHTLSLPGNEDVRSVNPVVGETNDGWLNDIRRRSLTREHFLAALREARGGPVPEGTVGAGTGSTAFGMKGGIGTASRRAAEALGGSTVGVLVQSNFGGALTMGGVAVGAELDAALSAAAGHGATPGPEGGSCMIVVATDAPLDSSQLRRLASRALAGMARTGASFSSGSGDYVIAFSTAESARIPHPGLQSPAGVLSPERVDALFRMAADATEEAIYGSLLRATTVKGTRGHESRALPVDTLRRILARHRAR